MYPRQLFNAFQEASQAQTPRQHPSPADILEQQHRQQRRELQERGPPPASNLALKNIPDIQVVAHDLAEETNHACSICLDDFNLGDKAVKLPCAHIFHRECVWEWLELHCTCPVCRFELETDDRKYEAERRVRMRGRRPRYRLRELEQLSIPQIRNVARSCSVNITGCLEKRDIVQRIIDAGAVDLMTDAEVQEVSSDSLAAMSLRELRDLMRSLGVGVDGCLEKADLLERVTTSGLINVISSVQAEEGVPTLSPTEQLGNAGLPGAATGSAGVSANSLRDSMHRESLTAMSVSQLRQIMRALELSSAMCIEKRDMVTEIVQSGRYGHGSFV
ncbi:unnamed protein product [Choristocarpus tenellus]